MPEKWDQVKELFTLALERDPEGRSDFLRRACGADDSLRAEIESLLSSFDGAAATFLEDCPAAALLSAQSRAMTGRRIGAYRIIRECGHGGMAVVYLAERADDQYRKRVAIKMLKPGTSTDEVLRRFRNERQALAGLDHPNIVRLLDGGSTEEGLPYLIMDYVEGVPIDEYCDLNRLSIPERLQLFRAVCLAVQYAHETLVIHRDLKPSNILITKEGVARLLDFGIAKVLNPQWSSDTTLTRTAWRPMTPEYASPEQVRGEAVTNATDIYSLGVLLYQLLTGRRPYRVRPDSPLEIERSICDEEPEKPSAAVSRIDEKVSHDGTTQTVISPQLVGAARAIRPEELPHRLRGDLDTLVMKAIRKEAEYRYASAEEFAKDIERHLSGMPIKARKPTLLYRGGKFVHRHRESLATAVLIVTVATGLGSWEARRLWKQRSVSEQQSSTVHVRIRPSVAILGFKNLSNRQDTAWISTALSEMLTEELAAGEQLRTVPGETVARTKIDLGLSDVESLAPATLMQVRKNLANDFIILGSYLDMGQEKGQIRLDLRLEDAAKGETVAAVSEMGTEKAVIDLASQVGSRLRQQIGLEKLSQVESAALRAELPSNPEAMRSFSQGLAKIRAFDALSARDLLSHAVAADPSFPLAHSALAKVWSSLGYDSNARQEAKKALDEAGSLSREKHLLVEARFYETSKDWGKAIEAYQTLFSFFPDNLEYGLQLANAETAGGRGKDALKSLAALDALGTQARSNPQIDLARADAAAALGDDRLRRDAAELAAQKAGEQGAKLLVARALSSECRALANLGENQKAESACGEARQIYAAAGDRSGLARTLHYMAEVPLNQDDLDTAEQLYRQALSITREIGDEQGTGRELVNLGVIFKKRGDLVRARATYAEAYRIDQEAGDKNAMAVVTGNMGNVLQMQGKLPEAMKSYEIALALSNEVGHKSSAALALSNIAETLAMEGNLADASRMFQQALTTWEVVGDRGYYAGTLVSLGRLFQQQAELDRARKNYLDALTTQEHLGLKGEVADTQLAIAELNCDVGKAAEAESQARKALETFRGEAYFDAEISAQAVLSRSLLQQGKTNEARAAIAEAMRLSEKSQDVTVRIPVILDHAYVMAAGKDLVGAARAAQQALTQARTLGLSRLQLEASLTLGQVEMQAKPSAAARARLQTLEKRARAKGFELIARKAANANGAP
jgi:serine/threonine protein kinase/tetratricopeptide (TPR) repeat protein